MQQGTELGWAASGSSGQGGERGGQGGITYLWLPLVVQFELPSAAGVAAWKELRDFGWWLDCPRDMELPALRDVEQGPSFPCPSASLDGVNKAERKFRQSSTSLDW